MRPSNLLAVALLAASAVAVVACGSTIEQEGSPAEDGASGGADDGADDGADGTGSDGGDDGSSGSDDGGDDGGEEPCGGEPREPECPSGEAACVDGTWVCPPAPECPADPPAEGSACEVPGQQCEYGDGTECGYPPTYECRGGAWENIEDELLFRCSPIFCGDIGDRESCDASGCRWLEPGCSDDVPALKQAGCFDIDPCVEGSCPTIDQVCAAVMVAPDCEDCDACGVAENLCVAQGAI